MLIGVHGAADEEWAARAAAAEARAQVAGAGKQGGSSGVLGRLARRVGIARRSLGRRD